jgi:hypothetical protein
MTPPLALRALFALVPVAPFLPPLLAHVPVLGALGGVLDGWFGFQCERDPARTFAGAAVCVRCLGIYVGFGLGGAAPVAARAGRLDRGGHARHRARRGE